MLFFLIYVCKCSHKSLFYMQEWNVWAILASKFFDNCHFYLETLTKIIKDIYHLIIHISGFSLFNSVGGMFIKDSMPPEFIHKLISNYKNDFRHRNSNCKILFIHSGAFCTFGDEIVSHLNYEACHSKHYFSYIFFRWCIIIETVITPTIVSTLCIWTTSCKKQRLVVSACTVFITQNYRGISLAGTHLKKWRMSIVSFRKNKKYPLWFSYFSKNLENSPINSKMYMELFNIKLHLCQITRVKLELWWVLRFHIRNGILRIAL